MAARHFAEQVKSPVREYRTVINDSGDPGYVNRLLIGTASTGVIRMEWHMARAGQICPVNWSQVQLLQWMNSYIPLRYQVADAQNLIVKEVVSKDFEWLLLYEHDVIPPPDGFIRINEYILSEEAPVVSGLYYTRSRPAEPLVFRGKGTSYYARWKMGDRVWCDGVPTGFLLVHAGLLRTMWAESAEYVVNNQVTRRVFETPRAMWLDQATGQFNSISGTSDLDWCTRVIEGRYLEKSGWGKYQKMKYPFLVDTGILCRHIDINGVQYP